MIYKIKFEFDVYIEAVKPVNAIKEALFNKKDIINHIDENDLIKDIVEVKNIDQVNNKKWLHRIPWGRKDNKTLSEILTQK